GRVLGVVTEAENGRWVAAELKQYGPRGAVVREWEPDFVSSRELPSPREGLGSIRYTYDGVGRVLETLYDDGTREEVRYTPLRRELWDAFDLDEDSPFFGTPLTHEQDGQGRLTAVIERIDGDALVTRFTTDALGRNTSVTDAAGNRTTWRYDGLGRLLEVVHPDAGHRRMRYDADGNLIEWSDSLGNRLVRTYDDLSRTL